MMSVVMLALMGALVQPALAAEGTSDMDILIQKVKADKKLLVATNMDLTDAEAKAFWPVYEAYQKDLQPVNELANDQDLRRRIRPGTGVE
jgi:hypothetical protein